MILCKISVFYRKYFILSGNHIIPGINGKFPFFLLTLLKIEMILQTEIKRNVPFQMEELQNIASDFRNYVLAPNQVVECGQVVDGTQHSSLMASTEV